MIDEELLVKYSGDMADRHLLPAYEAGLSIQGIARSITMVTTYLGTGKVRKNAPFNSPIDVFLKPIRHGSLDTLYQIVSNIDPIIAAADVAIGITGSVVYDTIKVVFNRVTGKDDDPETPGLKKLDRLKGGDLSALEDAVEPALVHAHRVIGQGSNNIVIFGNNNKIVFNQKTKDFISTSRLEEVTQNKLVSVASYNVNTKSGRLYDFEFKKTVPFSLDRMARQRSAVAIARSLTRYANDEESKVEITYSKVLAPDDRVKRYIIYRAVIPAREI